MRVAVSDIAGTIGESDLHGKLDIDASRKRPYMRGDLVSKQLRMKDLAASLGGQPKGADSLDAKPQRMNPTGTPSLLKPRRPTPMHGFSPMRTCRSIACGRWMRTSNSEQRRSMPAACP
jgi:hypothetical protein